jgi:hypothetical protein
MKALYEKTGWPVQGHNRYWTNNTDYARQNGGDYEFILEPYAENGGKHFLTTSTSA